MTGESTEHFIAKDSVITKCRCNIIGKCKYSPCLSCHARGPCIHCADGVRRRTRCKYWEARETTIPKMQSMLLTKELFDERMS